MRVPAPLPLLLLVTVVLLSLHESSAFPRRRWLMPNLRHRWLVPNLYFPMIRALDRKATTARKVFGGLSRLLALLGRRRRRSLDSPAGDLCELQQPCLALEAMDAGRLDQWVTERWPGSAGSWQSEPQLSQLFSQLTELQRAERPHSRQLRRRVCGAVRRRCSGQKAGSRR